MNKKIEDIKNQSINDLLESSLFGLVECCKQGDFVIKLKNNKGNYILVDHMNKIENDDYELYIEIGKALYQDLCIGDVSAYFN